MRFIWAAWQILPSLSQVKFIKFYDADELFLRQIYSGSARQI